MNWMLIIAIGGFTSVTDVQVHEGLTEAQCRQAVISMSTIDSIGAACIAPDGTAFETKDARQ